MYFDVPRCEARRKCRNGRLERRAARRVSECTEEGAAHSEDSDDTRNHENPVCGPAVKCTHQSISTGVHQ